MTEIKTKFLADVMSLVEQAENSGDAGTIHTAKLIERCRREQFNYMGRSDAAEN